MEGEQNRAALRKKEKKRIIVLELTIRCETKEEQKNCVAWRWQRKSSQQNTSKSHEKNYKIILSNFLKNLNTVVLGKFSLEEKTGFVGDLFFAMHE